MRKIIVGAQVSMDGVMQAPGGPWEDPTKGFEFGGWVMPYFDQALSANVRETVTPWEFNVEGESGSETDERGGAGPPVEQKSK